MKASVKELSILTALLLAIAVIASMLGFAVGQVYNYADCISFRDNTASIVTFSPVSGCYVMTEDFEFVSKDSIVSIVTPAKAKN